MSHHQFIWFDPIQIKAEVHLPWSDQKQRGSLVAIMLVKRKLHTMTNKNIVLHLLLCSEMCLMLRQHMAFLHAGFFNIKNPCCASSCKISSDPGCSHSCCFCFLLMFVPERLRYWPNLSRFEGQSLVSWASRFSLVSSPGPCSKHLLGSCSIASVFLYICL